MGDGKVQHRIKVFYTAKVHSSIGGIPISLFSARARSARTIPAEASTIGIFSNFHCLELQWESLCALSWWICCVHCSLHPTADSWEVLPPLEDVLADAHGYDQEEFYMSFRAVAVGAEIYIGCRASENFVFCQFNTFEKAWKTGPFLDNWVPSSGGWGQSQYRDTLQLVAVDSKVIAICRGSINPNIACFDTLSETWSIPPTIKFMPDDGGFGQEEYSTFSAVGLGSKLYITGRAHDVLCFATLDTNSMTWTEGPHNQTGYPSEGGWGQPKYYKTFHALCGRQGVRNMPWRSGCGCACVDPAANAWQPIANLDSYVHDEGGFGEPHYYETFSVC